jgi:hypothetical protein
VIYLGYQTASTWTSPKTTRVKPKDILVIEDSSIDDDRFPGQQRRRNLAKTSCELNTLVVRVTVGDGNAPPCADELYAAIFNDPYCLKSQYEACSYIQLQIQPYKSRKINGVDTSAVSGLGVVDVTINMNAAGADKYDLQYQSEVQVTALFNKSSNIFSGSNNLGNIFDLVLFCMPPGTSGGWDAYAYINGFTSYYNDY